MDLMWQEKLTDEEGERMVQSLAHKIVRRRMQTPAILFLEMHKPLANVGGHAMLVTAPFLIPFVGYDAVNDYSRLMSDRRWWERLVDLLDESRTTQSEETTSACNT